MNTNETALNNLVEKVKKSGSPIQIVTKKIRSIEKKLAHLGFVLPVRVKVLTYVKQQGDKFINYDVYLSWEGYASNPTYRIRRQRIFIEKYKDSELSSRRVLVEAPYIDRLKYIDYIDMLLGQCVSNLDKFSEYIG